MHADLSHNPEGSQYDHQWPASIGGKKTNSKLLGGAPNPAVHNKV